MPAQVRIHHWLSILGTGMLRVTITVAMASRMRTACLGPKARAAVHSWFSAIAIWRDGNRGDSG
jgi:hypothetical protein